MPQFEAKGVSLYAVLHEDIGFEQFSKFFKGEVLLDSEKRFYGPKERRTLIMGMLRLSVWSNIARASSKNITGNFEGDGSLLGGVYLLGPGNQGILFEHHEAEFGDMCNKSQLLQALEKIEVPSQE